MPNPSNYLQQTARMLDMATEAHSLLKGDADTELSGVSHSEEAFCGGKIVTIKILNQNGANIMGRDIGTYTTIELPNIHTAIPSQLIGPASAAIAGVIRSLLPPPKPSAPQPLLLVGLGNFKTTADAIGPKVISHIQPTRHFYRAELAAEISPVAAIAPGVVGNTGIETAALIKGACLQINPAAVIVIDALAARQLANVMASIQICDTGIRPGSGVQNHRQAINSSYLGVPVLAVGIPTVVQTASVITKSVQLALNTVNHNKNTEEIVDTVAQTMLSSRAPNLIMTPKEADELVPLAALIIAAGLTRALHPGAEQGNFADYMQGV